MFRGAEWLFLFWLHCAAMRVRSISIAARGGRRGSLSAPEIIPRPGNVVTARNNLHKLTNTRNHTGGYQNAMRRTSIHSNPEGQDWFAAETSEVSAAASFLEQWCVQPWLLVVASLPSC